MLEGSPILRFRAAGQTDMAWHLYHWGDIVEVIEPKKLWTMLEGAPARRLLPCIAVAPETVQPFLDSLGDLPAAKVAWLGRIGEVRVGVTDAAELQHVIAARARLLLNDVVEDREERRGGALHLCRQAVEIEPRAVDGEHEHGGRVPLGGLEDGRVVRAERLLDVGKR